MIEKCFACYVTVVFREGRRGCVVKWLIPDQCSDSEHPCTLLILSAAYCKEDRPYIPTGWLTRAAKQWAWTTGWIYERERKKKRVVYHSSKSAKSTLTFRQSFHSAKNNKSFSFGLSELCSRCAAATEQPCSRSLVTSHYRGGW